MINLIEVNEDIVDAFNFNVEASEYWGCSYSVNNNKIIQRRSKITPTKIGQFVTLWKRDKNGETCPLDLTDNFDYVVILCESESNSGHFLFPKEVLADKGYICSKKHKGKRGFRVYPSWDKPTARQAIKTQNWQLEYFKETSILDSTALIQKEVLTTSN
ncbi:MepB family protein [Bacteriovorax sp. Seq25_V]|uniref:MepB family protein n=1 Tax=Bacteriovorax sp. Seq25_V TaxID=1201288 RepID=UPI00038A1681|nr:MepB family protein [Bacteriovorax sp. Seq25_V]EQC45500.1 MepB protein [Bacteriovorax sp. Seq25_V]